MHSDLAVLSYACCVTHSEDGTPFLHLEGFDGGSYETGSEQKAAKGSAAEVSQDWEMSAS